MTLKIIKYTLSIPFRVILTIGIAMAWTMNEADSRDFKAAWRVKQ